MALLRHPSIKEYIVAVGELESEDLQTSIEAALTLLNVKSVFDLPSNNPIALTLSPSELESVQNLSSDRARVETKASEVLARINELNSNKNFSKLKNLFTNICKGMLDYGTTINPRSLLGATTLLRSSIPINNGHLLIQISELWGNLPQDSQIDLMNRLSAGEDTGLVLQAASIMLQSAQSGLQKQKIVDWLSPLLFSSEKTDIASPDGTFVEGTAAELTCQIFRSNDIHPSVLPVAGFGFGLAALRMRTANDAAATSRV